MERARLVKIFAVLLFLMVIIMPGRAVAADEEEEMGELLIELLMMGKVCGDYLHSNPEGVCDTTGKLEHYRLSFNPLLFVSGDMRADSGEITVRPPQGSSLREKLSFSREGKLFRHTRDGGKVELSPKEFESPIDKAGRTRAIRNLKHAFTACKAYLADNPKSSCDSLGVLEEKGFKLGNLIKLVEADMGSSAGSITLESRITEMTYEIDHAGKVSEAELSYL